MTAWFGKKDDPKPESPAAKAAQNAGDHPEQPAEILIITDDARDKINELIANTSSPVLGIRVLAEATSPVNPQYSLAFVQDGESYEDDTVLEFEGFKVFIDADSMPLMENVQLDFSMNQGVGGFRLNKLSPAALSGKGGPLADRVRAVIKDQINPALALHGGFVNLIDVQGTTAYVELGGGCKGCGMVDVTLKQGIETMIKQNIPEITEILDSTDHASGQNPYYQPSK
ncbi:MAG TPA: NifU family protein [Calditrichia bacterium]|nr:NifU family protein [Calditrichia bacterium]